MIYDIPIISLYILFNKQQSLLFWILYKSKTDKEYNVKKIKKKKKPRLTIEKPHV